ncbi:MAG: hypothetical protein HGA53_04435 [Anaerolineaceae bacterium]|nr:hypothetical protein [Anaerolineaceae bacterium]
MTLQSNTLVGVVMVVLAIILILVFSIPRKKAARAVWRPIPALQRLKRAIGLSVEAGTRLHISMGKSSLLSPSAASALVSLSMLERIALLSSVSDRPPVVTSGDGALSILSQDSLKSAYRLANMIELYSPERGILAGVTPFSYVAGTIPVMNDQQISANILLGNFGPEAALLAEVSEQSNMYTLAASDSLPAQAVLFATARDTLIGEELFAAPTYLGAGNSHQASLKTQDILRWGIIAALFGGALLKFTGII